MVGFRPGFEPRDGRADARAQNLGRHADRLVGRERRGEEGRLALGFRERLGARLARGDVGRRLVRQLLGEFAVHVGLQKPLVQTSLHHRRPPIFP